MTETLTPTRLASDLLSQYQDRRKTFSAIIIGEKAVGKTSLLKTCRKPVLLLSFDPEGELVLLPEIERGEILPITTYQRNDADSFSLFMKDWKAWTDTEGFFEQFGTVCLDTITTFGEAGLEWVLSQVAGIGKHGPNMEIQDWGTFLNTMRYWIKTFLALPCDTMILGHIQKDTDELTGRIMRSLMIPGQTGQRAPIWSSEVYYLCSEEKLAATKFDPEGKTDPPRPRRYLVTAHDGVFHAGTRLGSPDQGNFKLHEKPDIKYLLEKAGLPTEDLPLIGKEES